jgi:hypothetical protein
VLPLIVWSGSVLMTYYVWEAVRDGGRWWVAPGVLAAEYGVVLATAVWMFWRRPVSFTQPRPDPHQAPTDTRIAG